MDTGVSAHELTGCPTAVSVWDARRLAQQRNHRSFGRLCEVIDTMGSLSREAQGINHALTSVQKIRDNPQHRLYLMCEGTKCLAILKVGVKKLFIRTRSAQLVEMDPLCILDFFVYPSEQRAGYGRTLYDYVLAAENVTPERLAIDRPSPKLLSFMKKHFGLHDYVQQTNNFVVFSQYFEPQGPRVGSAQCSTRQLAPIGRAPSLSATTTVTTAPPATTNPPNARGALGMSASRTAPDAMPVARTMPPPRPTALSLAPNAAAPSAGGPFKARNNSPTRSAVDYNILSPPALGEVQPRPPIRRSLGRY